MIAQAPNTRVVQNTAAEAEPVKAAIIVYSGLVRVTIDPQLVDGNYAITVLQMGRLSLGWSSSILSQMSLLSRTWYASRASAGADRCADIGGQRRRQWKEFLVGRSNQCPQGGGIRFILSPHRFTPGPRQDR